MPLRSFAGFLCITLAAVLWGVFGTLARFFFVNQLIGPFTLLEIRLSLSFGLLLLYAVLFRPSLLRVGRSDIGPLILFGMLGLGALQLLYLLTISQLNVVTAVFLQYLAPVLIALWEAAAYRRFPGPAGLVAILVTTVGGFLMMRGAHAAGGLTWTGVLTGLGTAAAFAFYSVYGKRLTHLPAWTVLLYGLGFPLAAWSFLHPPWTAMAGHSPWAWGAFFYLALFSTILPFGLFMKGLSYLSPLQAGLTSTLEPVVAGLSAYLLLGEGMHPLQIAGAALVLGGVVLIQLPDRRSG